MFNGCSSLISAPVLRAQLNETHEACYYRMFKDCTSLKKVQTVLPATTLANYCYEEMFSSVVFSSFAI